MKLLVTGAGLLGSALSIRLHELGHEVTVFDNREPGQPLSGRFIKGDIRDPDSIRRAVARVDGIHHTAALHGIHVETNTPTEFMEINSTGTFNVLEAARLEGVRRVVFSSSTAVFYTRDVPKAGPVEQTTEATPRRFGDTYSMTKLFGELMLEHYSRRHSLEVVSLRYGAIRQLVAKLWGINLFWALSGFVTDLRDAVEANILAMTHPQPEFGYIVVPTTLLDQALLTKHEWNVEAALRERVAWLEGVQLSESPPCPRLLFDAGPVTEHHLGLRFICPQEELLREALNWQGV